MRRLIALAIAAVAPAAVAAQAAGAGRSGPRPLLPRDQEIALARSAAPPQVSDSATVYVLTTRGYVIAARGTNGVACYVSRGWPESVEPHCFDAEGTATILPMEMRRVELMHASVAADSIEREIAFGLASGRYRLPRRPAMTWMMSGGQRLINDEGRAAGRWEPHLMIYYPYLTEAELGLGATPDPRHAILVDGGKPTANLMIIVRSFIEPRVPLPPPGSTGPR